MILSLALLAPAKMFVLNATGPGSKLIQKQANRRRPHANAVTEAELSLKASARNFDTSKAQSAHPEPRPPTRVPMQTKVTALFEPPLAITCPVFQAQGHVAIWTEETADARGQR